MNEKERWAKEHWDRGASYDDWKRTMTRNLDRLEANESAVNIPAEDREALSKVRPPLRVVALAADWCGDVIANLPVLGRVTKDTGAFDLRVFERDSDFSPIDMYLNQGQYKSIPVFAFFDQDWNEVGTFFERPDSVTELRARKRREVYASRSEFGSPDAPADQLPDDVRTALQAALQKMRDETRDQANAEVIRELRAIAERRSRWGGVRQPATA
ncbi:MAG: thioredoxin family protein [Candidatus Limnocylindria bacterium]